MENQKDKNTIKEIRTLTGLSEGQISEVFKALAHTVGIGNYYNEETINIPYFGSFKLKFEGDEINKQGNRLAKVTGFFSLHKSLKKNVGLVEDFKKTQDTSILMQLDAYKEINANIKQSLKSID